MSRSASRRLAACLLVSAAAAAFAEEARGPDFTDPLAGSAKFTSGINNLAGRPDLDDYVGRLAEGETLSVTVAAARRSSMLPGIAILGPDGAPRAVTVVEKKGGFAAQVKGLVADASGTWVVRVTGREGSQGDYTASFRVKAAKGGKLKKQTLGVATPLTADHPVPGLEGGSLSFTLKWSGKEEPVGVQAVDDPSGDPVPNALAALSTQKTSAKLKKHPLATGDGDYTVSVGIGQGSATYDIAWKVAAPTRPRGGKALALAPASDPLIDPVAQPTMVIDGGTVTVRGRNFSTPQFPEIWFGDAKGTVLSVVGTRDSMEVMVPPGLPGTTVGITVVNPDRQSASSPAYVTYAPGLILQSASIVSGTVVNGNEVPLTGGNRVRATGTDLDLVVQVFLGGQEMTPLNLSPTSFEFVAPSLPNGPATLVVVDGFGRQQVLSNVMRYVGFRDVTGMRTQIGGAVDDFSAWRGAVGDLDRDGTVDDFVATSYGTYDHYLGGGPNGTRSERSRLFFRTTLHSMDDYTGGRVPAAGSDVTRLGNWSGRAVAVADFDGRRGADFVVAGTRPTGWNGQVSFPFDNFTRIQLFLNDGVGAFELSEDDLPATGYLTPQSIDSDQTDPESGYPIQVALRTSRRPGLLGTALAVGDLDGDGDPDVVLGTDRFGTRNLNFDPADVDYGVSPPYIKTATASTYSREFYYPATRILLNDLSRGNGLEDDTEARMPSAGSSLEASVPAFHARDIALGDVDGDSDLDAVVTWSNPDTVTAYGLRRADSFYTQFTNILVYVRPPNPAPVVATRVLLNNGSGAFTDGTASWMPAASDPVFFQGHRVRLADLDGDGDLDMTVLHRRSIEAFKGGVFGYSHHSLRILRNDRVVASGPAAEHFVDVTATALPALPPGSDETFRGGALLVEDINGDGRLDLLVGTREPLEDDAGQPLPSLRLFLGQPGLTFVDGGAFLPPYSSDSGEADDLLRMSILDNGQPTFILLSEVQPRVSGQGQFLRALDWTR